MRSRMHTRTFSAYGAWTLPGEIYLATLLGGGLGSHPPTLNLPLRTATDHHLPKVPLNTGLSDDLHAVRTVFSFNQVYGLLLAMLQHLISVSSGAVVQKCEDWKEERLPPPQ